MASIDKRRGKWRAQVRRQGHILIKTFTLKHDAKVWVREAERAIDQERDPPGSLCGRRVSKQDAFASLIDLHINDLHAHGKPVRRSKGAWISGFAQPFDLFAARRWLHRASSAWIAAKASMAP